MPPLCSLPSVAYVVTMRWAFRRLLHGIRNKGEGGGGHGGTKGGNAYGNPRRPMYVYEK